jgi:hypothetical protein
MEFLIWTAAVTGDCTQNRSQQPDPRPSAPGRS